MLVLPCEDEPVHLEILRSVPQLRALSWIPPISQDDSISDLQNLIYLTHLDLSLGTDHNGDIITLPITLPSLQVLLLSIYTWDPKSISRLSTPLLSKLWVEGIIDDVTAKEIEGFILQHKDTIMSLIVDRIKVMDPVSRLFEDWHYASTFWGSFPNLSLFAVDLAWFVKHDTIPEGLDRIAPSNQSSFLTVILHRLEIDKANSTVAQNLTGWCSSHRSPLPIKRVAMMESWEMMMNRIKSASGWDFGQIRGFLGEFYKGGMKFCDQNGVDFYDEGNEKLRNVSDVPVVNAIQTV